MLDFAARREERSNTLRNRLPTVAILVALVVPAGSGQELVTLDATTSDLPELRRFTVLVDDLARSDDLVLVSSLPDTQLQGRVHENLTQYHLGVPVRGGGVTRQLAGGVPVSIFGTIYRGLTVDTTPRLTPAEALGILEQRAGTGPASDDEPTLVVLPTMLGQYVLVWQATMRDRRTYFVDAHTGAVVQDESVVYEQDAAVGDGRGIAGQRKKVSASSVGGDFRAHDRLRPAEIVTLDMRYSEHRFDSLLDSRGARWAASDVARDADNHWQDAAVVDAHVYTGFTYDYLLRQGWRGMNGRDGRILPMVNVDLENAFFIPPPFGPEKTGGIAFGQLRDGTPLVVVDAVAHEIMHGVTHFSVSRRTGERGGLLPNPRSVQGPSSFTVRYPNGTSWTGRCGTRYRYNPGDCYVCGRAFYLACRDGRILLFMDHGGTIHEAFSDIIGTAVEFSVHSAGSSVHADGPGPLRADYQIGEDLGVIFRSLRNPRSIRLAPRSNLRHPDQFSDVVRFAVEYFPDREEAFYSNVGSVDGGRRMVVLPSYGYSGAHWNSTVLSHAFYLAIEGGRHAPTGINVRGVGRENRSQVEQAFFRAMTYMMPATATLPRTANLVRQSAIDLFGVNSPTYRALRDAFRAVGL